MTMSFSQEGSANPPQINITKRNITTNNNLNSTSKITDSSRSPSISKHKRDSKISVSTSDSVRSHKDYIDSLETPSREVVQRIAAVQEKKEVENIKRRLSMQASGDEMNESERLKAAELIQRNYRGHRERRMLNGMSLDPSTRWVEAVKEARYRQLTEPRARQSNDLSRPSLDGSVPAGADAGVNGTTSTARQNWKKIGVITRRAGADEESDDSGSDDDSGDAQDREARLKRKHEAKMERQKAAKIMDLQYFLEMVDLKHRYGSNLRTYHEEWKKAETNENFFYWLDYGEGRFVDCQGCPRERLDRERVRYLSKEERLNYLVKIDKEGRLVWAKNGARIDTTEQYKDSIHGIVPADDNTPAFTPADGEAATGPQDHSSRSSSSSHGSGSEDRADVYMTPEFDNSKGMKKVKHVSAATIFNKLLRGSVKKNTWIFVADTNFRLYVGIKQSGAFQHSSFLHGSRISAAGLIKVKNGRLSKLSPLSGHYRPPVSNFRAFIHNLKENGVDMSHVSISRSYAVLVGLEAYVKTRRRGKKLIKKLTHHRDKLLSPEEVAKKEEETRDKSQSAEKERQYLERKAREEQEARDNMPLMEKLHLGTTTEREREGKKDPDIQAPGTGPENAIAPEGRRDL